MNVTRSCVLIALLTGLLAGCGQGAGPSAIPTTSGPKVERGDVRGMSGFDDIKLPKPAKK